MFSEIPVVADAAARRAESFSHMSAVPVQSQSYFTTGGLPPISSSWRQAP
jgi:hypothetical protein